MKNWYISWDPYSDKFQIYDNMFDFNNTHYSVKKNKDITVFFNEKGKEVLLNIENVYDKLPYDFDTMKKEDIIKLVKPFLNVDIDSGTPLRYTYASVRYADQYCTANIRVYGMCEEYLNSD
ncbi:MAG: hypothetical protein AABY22_03460 [Nanoarchaeota archaeon]